eukprot:8792433-Pyramimonas_sp.AAC.1
MKHCPSWGAPPATAEATFTLLHDQLIQRARALRDTAQGPFAVSKSMCEPLWLCLLMLARDPQVALRKQAVMEPVSNMQSPTKNYD